MSFLDQALSHLNGVDLSAIAGKVGPPDQVQAAIAALAQQHEQPGDTAEGAAAQTGLPLDQIQQVLQHIGGEGVMAKITGALGGLGGGAGGGGLGGMLGAVLEGMTPALRATLIGAARMLAAAREPWWVVTGAAAALHGVAGEVGDVDLLVGGDDAVRLLGAAAAPGVPSERYRSAVFGRIAGLPLPVEVMAGFELRVDGAWRPVAFATREPIAIDGATLFVPARAELAAWLATIGRPKDLARSAALAS